MDLNSIKVLSSLFFINVSGAEFKCAGMIVLCLSPPRLEDTGTGIWSFFSARALMA